jgi:chemotaxis protein MotB
MSKKKKCKKTECPAGEKWAVPYADFLSLLLALFIALYALASINKAKLAAVRAAFVKIYSYSPKSERINPVMDMRPKSSKGHSHSNESGAGKGVLNSGMSVRESDKVTNMVKQALGSAKKLIKKNEDGANIFIQNSETGFIINLPASLLFQKNSAKITNQDALLLLKRIVLIIDKMPPNVEIMVNGYTDNEAPAASSPYKNNWQLSSARALSVVSILMQDGVPGKRLAAVAYGQYRPIATNTTPQGREKNRRVTISFMAKNADSKEEKRNILDKASGVK